MFTVKILMEAVEVARLVLEKQRRRTGLARCMTSLDEFGVFRRVADVNLHGFVPRIRDRYELAIKTCTQAADKVWQWITEIFVFATAKAVTGHHYPAPKSLFICIQTCQFITFVNRKGTAQHRVSIFVQPFRNAWPIHGLSAGDRPPGRRYAV